MYPVLVAIGSFRLYSLSIFLILAWCVFSFRFWKLLRAQAVEEGRIFDLTFYATGVAIVVSRLAFVLLHPNLFSGNLLKVAALWIQPGLSFWGGLVGLMLTLVYLARRFGIRVGHVLDAVAMALPWALMVGSIGAFLDGSEVGRPTNLPWAVIYVGYPARRHPLGGYEIPIFILLGILVAWLNQRAKRGNWPYGVVGIWFFMLLSISMFGVEFVKVSDVYWKSLSANQWILIGLFGQAVGAFYVRGGGREAIRPRLRQVTNFLVQRGVWLYERFFSRFTP